jgi:hypothetical protein
MLNFNLAVPLFTTKVWAMDKLGSPVDPEAVQDGGNQLNGPWYVKQRPSLLQASMMHLYSLDAATRTYSTADGTGGGSRPEQVAGL